MLARSQDAILINPTIFTDACISETPAATSDHVQFSFITIHFVRIILVSSSNDHGS